MLFIPESNWANLQTCCHTVTLLSCDKQRGDMKGHYSCHQRARKHLKPLKHILLTFQHRCFQPIWKFKLTSFLLLPRRPSDCCHPVPLYRSWLSAKSKDTDSFRLHFKFNMIVIRHWQCGGSCSLTLMASTIMSDPLLLN